MEHDVCRLGEDEESAQQGSSDGAHVTPHDSVIEHLQKRLSSRAHVRESSSTHALTHYFLVTRQASNKAALAPNTVQGRRPPAKAPMRALSSCVLRAVPVREPTCSRPKGGCSRSRVTRCQAGASAAVQCNRRAALAAAAALTLALPCRALAAPAFGAPSRRFRTARGRRLRVAICACLRGHARVKRGASGCARAAIAESLSARAALPDARACRGW